MCPMSVFTWLWNCRETYSVETGNWDLMAKDLFFPGENWRVAASNLPEKQCFFFFSLHYNNSCSHNFEIKRMLPTSGLKVKLTVQFHVIRGTTRMGVKTHRTLSPDIFFFSWNGPLCPWCVFVQR